MYQSLSG